MRVSSPRAGAAVCQKRGATVGGLKGCRQRLRIRVERGGPHPQTGSRPRAAVGSRIAADPLSQ